jgi:hypothetical protein
MGPVVSKGFWTSLSDWIGPNSLDHANKDTRWKKFFSNTDSAIALELESEIDRATRLWLGALHPPQPLHRDPDKETDDSFYNRLGVGKLSFGVGIQKVQKACFDDIKRLRFRLITWRAQAPPLDDPRRMAFFGRYGDRGVRQLLLGCAHPLVPLLSEELQVAVQRSFGLPLTVLAGQVGDKIRNHANSAQCSVDKYGRNLQTVSGAKGDATRTLHDAFLAALAYSLRKAGMKVYGGSRNNCSYKHLFSYFMQAFLGADESTQRKLNGIIADLPVDFTSVAASASDSSDVANNLFDLVRTLCDAMTLACGDAYTSFSAAHLNDRETSPVKKTRGKGSQAVPCCGPRS